MERESIVDNENTINSTDLTSKDTSDVSKDKREFSDIKCPTLEEVLEYCDKHGIKSKSGWSKFTKENNKELPRDIISNLKGSGYIQDATEVLANATNKTGKPKSNKVIRLTGDIGNGFSKAGNSLGERVNFESKLTLSKDFSNAVSGLFRARDIRQSDAEVKCVYQVGSTKGMTRFDGQLDPFSGHTKLELMPLLIIGIITRMPKLLATADKTGKLKIEMHLTTLAETGENALRPEIEKFLEFEYEGKSYSIELVGLYAYREGTGSANVANNHIKVIAPYETEFVLLDCGGGTLSESFWSVGERPRLLSQTAHDAGVLILRRWFCKYAKTGDNMKLELSVFERAFNRAKPSVNGGYEAPSHLTKSLGDSFPPALEQWVQQSFLEDVFSRLLDLMYDGSHVYLCGGGFLNQALLHFVQTKFADFSEQLHVLPDCHLSNINGLLEPALSFGGETDGEK